MLSRISRKTLLFMSDTLIDAIKIIEIWEIYVVYSLASTLTKQVEVLVQFASLKSFREKLVRNSAYNV